jgi:SAM-dependent methyltransferase
MSKNQNTLAYYSSAAKAYVEKTVNLEMHDNRQFLLEKLPAGAHILDAGCGSGRDSLAFRNSGYQVTAFDGCAELAVEASALLGEPVQHLLFQRVDFVDEFDGIWASGSLLHLESLELSDALSRLFRALKSTGFLYASFKSGDGERVDNNGRFFNDMTLERAQRFVETAGGEIVSQSIYPDLMGRGNEWLRLVARRAA